MTDDQYNDQFAETEANVVRPVMRSNPLRQGPAILPMCGEWEYMLWHHAGPTPTVVLGPSPRSTPAE